MTACLPGTHDWLKEKNGVVECLDEIYVLRQRHSFGSGFARYEDVKKLHGVITNSNWVEGRPSTRFESDAFWEDIREDAVKTALIGGNLLVVERKPGDWNLPLRCSSAKEARQSVEIIRDLSVSSRPDLLPFADVIVSYKWMYDRLESEDELVYSFN